MTKILFLTNYYPPHHLGGYEELCEEVAEGLRKRGFKVIILTSNSGNSELENGDNDIYRLLELDVSNLPIISSLNAVIGINSRLARNLERVKKTIKENDPDLIMIWGMWNLSRSIAKFIEKLGEIPLVYLFADNWPLLSNNLILHWEEPSKSTITRLPRKILSNIFLKTTFINSYDNVVLKFQNSICVSNYLKSMLVKSGVLPSSSVVIHSGINILNFAPQINSQNNSYENSKIKRVLYAGRISPDKGISTAIEAIGKLIENKKPIELDIVGGGDSHYLKELKSKCKELKLENNVHFLGRVDRSKMLSVYAEYGILIVPSIKPDSLPRVVLEGMCSGCVVIGASIGGIPEMIEHKVNGFLFEPGNAKSLFLLLSELMEKPEDFFEIRIAARETVISKFSSDRFINGIEDYMQKILSR